MNAAPTLSSIIAPQYIKQLTHAKYSFGANNSCKVFRTGINHTYFIEGDECKYTFRLYSANWRSKDEIKEELNFINSLKDNSISVSYPIADKNGIYIQHINAPEGLRYGVLFSFAEGEKVRLLSNEDCYQMGLLLAKCHSVSQNKILNRMSYNAETLTELPYQYALKHFSSSLNEMQFVSKASQYIKEVLSKVDDNSFLRKGVVHLDFWYDNINITEDSNITLFDFDFCGNGLLALDIAYSTMQLFHTEPDKNAYEEKLSNFYKGYESITIIPHQEKELLPALGLAVWVFYLGVQAQRFDDWSNIFLTKNYLKHFISQAESWLSYNNVAI